jgi:hypothetical protein
MKKIMLAVCLMFGGATLVSAQEQDQTTPSQTETSTQDQEGQQVSISELPDGVTAQLESPDYSGWTVGTAYKKMDDQQNEIYVVELRQGTETKKVKFDSDGNKMEGDKHKDKDKSQNYRDGAEQDPSSQDASSTEDATEQDATDQADNTETQPDQK